MAPELTDRELYLWASEMYENEDLEEECSNVLKESCKKTRRDGSSFDLYIHLSPNMIEITCSNEMPSDPHLQMTAFHNACMMADFVWVDAMIRLGADTDRVMGTGDTPLSLVCSMLMADCTASGKVHPGCLRIFKRLLQVGVDPNVGCPLQYACAANDLVTCGILLANGADPRIQAADGRLPKEHFAAPLRRRFLKLPKGPRPEPLCWCLTSGVSLNECHGKENGQEADPYFGCPCKSGKSYAQCCKKRRLYFAETRTGFAECRSIPIGESSPFPRILQKYMAGKGPNDAIFPDVAIEDLMESRKSFSWMLLSTVDVSQYDPAFAYAFEQVDFYPTYWKYKLPRNERVLRPREWNYAIDDYIAANRAEDDTRTVREIEIAAKT